MIFREVVNYEKVGTDGCPENIGYEVMSIEAADIQENGTVVIPAEHSGAPVVSIGVKAGKGLEFNKLVIRSGVSAIRSNAFENSTVVEVALPSSVREIGTRAFCDCKKLQKVSAMDTPNKFLRLGVEVFKNDSALKSCEIAVKIFPVGTFENCEHLKYVFTARTESIEARAFKNSDVTSVKFDDTSAIKYIGNEAFAQCRNLKDVDIPDGVTVGDCAFTLCRRLNIAKIGNNVTLGEMAFMDCTRLETVRWSKSITFVPYGTFSGCKMLSEITGCETVTRTGDYAFYDTGIASLKVFESLKINQVGRSSFEGCSQLV